MAGTYNILIVDDEPNIREVLRFALRRSGYQTEEACNGKEAIEKFKILDPDLIVLDILMPEMDGTDVCRIIRKTSTVPILFLSSRDDEIDRIVGLELGGDDYVTKPFSPRELVARVGAVLRRSAPREGLLTAPKSQEIKTPLPTKKDGDHIRHYGCLTLDRHRFKIFWERHELIFTVTEFGIIKGLMDYPGKVYTRDELITKAYDDDTIVSDRTIDSHIRRIRKKFATVGGDPIETVHGLGYKLNSCKPKR